MNYDTTINKCKPLPVSIVQGDEYGILIRLRYTNWDGTKSLITPKDVEAVKIKIDKFEREWPDGSIVYDNKLHGWIFPLEEEMSRKLYGARKVQVGIKKNGVIQYSEFKQIQINTNIIKEGWDE